MHPSDEQPGNESFPPEFESSAGLPTQRLSLSPEVFTGLAGTGQPAADNTTWRVAFKIFKSKWRSWEASVKLQRPSRVIRGTSVSHLGL